MEKAKKQYTLYKRSNGIWYVRFRLADGTRSQGTSTGETAKSRADTWAIDYLQKTKGYIVKNSKITLADYSRDFFHYNGAWATNLKVEGKRISESHCKDRADTMRLYVLPALGNYRLEDIDKHIIRSFRNDLHGKGYSGSLINKCLYAIKTLLADAEDKGIIRALPSIIRASDTPTREKGILKLDEVRAMFSITWTSKASYSHPARPLTMGQTGNMLAAASGMRLSEIQGLRFENLFLDEGYLLVNKAWNNRMGYLNPTTKTGKIRMVTVKSKVRDALTAMLADYPYERRPDSFVFWAEKTPGKPAEKKVFTGAFRRGLDMIGISDDERKRRNISFHSWRHFYNTYMVNEKVPIPTIQKDTGHVTLSMTGDKYYHGDDRKLIKDALERMF